MSSGIMILDGNNLHHLLSSITGGGGCNHIEIVIKVYDLGGGVIGTRTGMRKCAGKKFGASLIFTTSKAGANPARPLRR